MSAPFRVPCSRHLLRLPGCRGHACAPLAVCTCVSTPNLRLAHCLCRCTSVHRPCTSLQCGIVWQTAFVTVHLYTDLTHLLVRHCLANCLCHCTSVHRSHTSFSAALSQWQTAFVTVHLYTDPVHLLGCSIVWQTAFVTLHLYTDIAHLFCAALFG